MCDRLRTILNRRSAEQSILLVALSVFICAVPRAASSSKIGRVEDVGGTWDMTVEIAGGASHPSLMLQQDGERISGSYEGQLGKSSVTGTLKEKEIEFTVNLKFQDATYSIVYSGTVSADLMEGTVQFSGGATGNWSAKRRKTQTK